MGEKSKTRRTIVEAGKAVGEVSVEYVGPTQAGARWLLRVRDASGTELQTHEIDSPEDDQNDATFLLKCSLDSLFHDAHDPEEICAFPEARTWVLRHADAIEVARDGVDAPGFITGGDLLDL